MPYSGFMSLISMKSGLAVASIATIGFLLRFAYRTSKFNTFRRVVPSPRDTLIPFLSHSEASTLPYRPDFFPGARDVDSPYGQMRVYEWGPHDGKKVMMVHGDTTPAPLFGPIAKALVEKGCRVLLLDLWGRGYSDTPIGLPHDTRLFTTQLLIAITSSPLSWTGSSAGGFSIIGFSLGGAITMSFAAHYPYLLNSIILLGPAGLLRSIPEDYKSICFRYASMVPPSYLRRLVGNILGTKLTNAPQRRNKDKPPTIYQEELRIPDKADLEAVDVPAVVQWQYDNHEGFVYSFINTILYAPLQHQHSDWKKICSIINGEYSTASSSKVHNSKILVIFGESDGIVVGKEVSEDLSQILGGHEHVVFKTVPGGHGFPVPSSEQVIGHICDFWKL
ncbi:hypothetical protein MMC27_004939 [Xylographa pallens]|nr:hypothetical protein [Xylographa pallens]